MLTRVFDFVCCAVALMVLLPLFLIVAVLVKLDSRGPMCFAQELVGRRGRRFYLYKFRTMVVNAAQTGLPITRGGEAIRPAIRTVTLFSCWLASSIVSGAGRSPSRTTG